VFDDAGCIRPRTMKARIQEASLESQIIPKWISGLRLQIRKDEHED
jgi:hypothetical protein